MSVLLTGAAGFIGACLARALLRALLAGRPIEAFNEGRMRHDFNDIDAREALPATPIEAGLPPLVNPCRACFGERR